MAYNRQHMLLQWKGDILGKPGPAADSFPIESFSGSMRFAAPGENPSGVDLAVVDNDNAFDAVVQVLTDFWSGTSSFIPNLFVLREAKWNRIGTDGKYVSQTETRQLSDLNVPGRKLAGVPAYLACVSTYRTSARRGLASKGRTYWPWGSFPEGSGTLLSTLQQTDVATQIAALIRSWGDWPGLDITNVVPCVMSDVRGGATRQIKSVSCGNELDIVQRRRIGQESYVTVNV